MKKALIICLVAMFLFAGLSFDQVEAQTFRWRLATTWTPHYRLIEQDYYFLEILKGLVGDELQIELYPAGSLIPGQDVFDSVQDGVIEMGSDFPGYWAGKDPAFNFLASYPMGLNAYDYISWIKFAGGWDEYQRVYGAYNIVYLPHGPIIVESGPRGTRPIASLEDYDGLRIRMSGRIQGYILAELGAAQVAIASAEVYGAMQRGVLDAAESCTPYLDAGLGYDEITTHSSHPGWHQPGSMCGLLVNKDAWNSLPDRLQNAIAVAAEATLLRTLAYQEYTSAKGAYIFADAGVEHYNLSYEELDYLARLSYKYAYQEAKVSESFARTAASYFGYYAYRQLWREQEHPLGQGWKDQPLPDVQFFVDQVPGGLPDDHIAIRALRKLNDYADKFGWEIVWADDVL